MNQVGGHNLESYRNEWKLAHDEAVTIPKNLRRDFVAIQHYIRNV